MIQFFFLSLAWCMFAISTRVGKPYLMFWDVKRKAYKRPLRDI